MNSDILYMSVTLRKTNNFIFWTSYSEIHREKPDKIKNVYLTIYRYQKLYYNGKLINPVLFYFSFYTGHLINYHKIFIFLKLTTYSITVGY